MGAKKNDNDGVVLGGDASRGVEVAMTRSPDNQMTRFPVRYPCTRR